MSSSPSCWNGTGFDAQRNWIAPTLWGVPTFLNRQSWMNLVDFDQDGRLDLLVSGMEHSPNLRLLFGGSDGFSEAGPLQFPDGPFGWIRPDATQPIEQGAEVTPVVIADFDNDGRPDIFSVHERIVYNQPGAITDPNIPDYEQIRANGGVVPQELSFQVFMNRGSRQFVDVTSRSSLLNLGWRHYNYLFPIDMNHDGFADVVGGYQLSAYGDVRGGQWARQCS